MPSRPSSRALAGLLAAVAIGGCAEPIATGITVPTASRGSAHSAADASAGFVADAPHLDGQVIVRFRAGAAQDAVLAKHHGRRKHDMLTERTTLVEVDQGDEAAAVERLRQDPDVEFAEMDFLYVISPCEVGNCQVGNEGFLGYKWDLHNTGEIKPGTSVLQVTGKADADIDWAEMRDALGPDFAGSATIGVVDTGIRPDHLDLVGRVVAAKNFASGYPATLTEDRDGHGSHVAGIAAANGTNNIGVPGVAYGKNIKLISAKACERYLFSDGVVRTSCPNSSVTDAVVWAVDNGANVLNLSLGGGAPTAAMQAALAYARAHNVLPFCASGNENGPVSYPAAYPECVAVGATNWNDQRASYSNYGPKVELSAPGGDSNPLGTPYSLILSVNGLSSSSVGSYVWKAGTSMATPQVVGLAAMVVASGVSDVNAVLERLHNTADDLGPVGRDPEFGFGRINAYRALTLKDPYAPPVVNTSASSYSALEGATLTFDASASLDPNNHPIRFQWTFSDGATSPLAALTKLYPDNGTFSATIAVTDESNHVTTKVLPVTIVNVAPSVSLSLSAASVASGSSITADGAFTDPGTLDAPWSWRFDWGNGSTTGSLTTQSPIAGGARRYCAPGSYTVRLGVTDKDGGEGSAVRGVMVVANPIAVSMPGSINGKATGNGTLPVRIVGSDAFDAATIDPATVTLGDGVGADVGVKRKPNGTLMAAAEGHDLVVHFDRQALASGELPDGASQLVLRAVMPDGCTAVRGSATVTVVP